MANTHESLCIPYRFPIPMRGNESTSRSAADMPRRPFPIPMRGNECLDGLTIETVASEFPIPMRGNEVRQPGGRTLRGSQRFRSP